MINSSSLRDLNNSRVSPVRRSPTTNRKTKNWLSLTHFVTVVVLVSVGVLLGQWNCKAEFEKNSIGMSAHGKNLGLSYTMEEQLKLHATNDKAILVVAVTYEYRRHLMNFKCNLAKVGMKEHFVVAALDKKLFEWGKQQGLPVFSVENIQADQEQATDTDYGGQGFKSVTKLKSRIVYQILLAGYTAVWSDVDITWFEHPLVALADYLDPAFEGIAIQSNAPYVQNKTAVALPHPTVKEVEDSPPAWRINSGLYVAKHGRSVITAFKEIIDHARQSTVSEQPSFDHVLCKRKPSQRYNSTCTFRPLEEPKGGNDIAASVVMLDQFAFPNGAVLVGPANDNVYNLGKKGFEKETGKSLFCAHNNWIVGHTTKQERQEKSGWWFLEDSQDTDVWTCRSHGQVASSATTTA